ncbi:hypothetical protein [Peribacillus acanthi]|uniref:hypothetical protein n=1 Tax=Peribacillus acanthi TaxID=2171554 RepID=UPI000D3E1FC7|nr:hypothetical protein [Peribacillus acanthi]
MNYKYFQKMLEDLQKPPYTDSHVSHKLKNDRNEVISLSYSDSPIRFRLEDHQGNSLQEFTNSEETANYLLDFINRR